MGVCRSTCVGVCRSTCRSVSNRGSVWMCVVLHVGLFLTGAVCGCVSFYM